MSSEPYIAVTASKTMRHVVDSWPRKASLVVVLTLTTFVIAVRPAARPAGHLSAPFGLTRMSLLSEAADRSDVPLPPPAEGETRSLEPLVLTGVLLLMLKTRRAPRRAVPVRRVKLPASRTSTAPFPDQR